MYASWKVLKICLRASKRWLILTNSVRCFDHCGDVLICLLINTNAPSHWLKSVAWLVGPVLKFRDIPDWLVSLYKYNQLFFVFFFWKIILGTSLSQALQMFLLISPTCAKLWWVWVVMETVSPLAGEGTRHTFVFHPPSACTLQFKKDYKLLLFVFSLSKNINTMDCWFASQGTCN